MYQYTFDEDTTNKVKNKTNKSKTIFEQFSEVDNKYNTLDSSNTNISLEKLTYDKPSESDVITKAENSLKGYKNSSVEAINENFDTKNKTLDQSIEKAKTKEQEDKNEIVSTYTKAKENAKDDAIKRGLARSSIIVNTLSAYDKGMLEELSSKSNAVATEISKFEAEKNSLEEQKQTALSSFDIEYAVKLQEKIDEINKQIQKDEQEIIKYNNEIAEMEAKWQKDQADSDFDKITNLAKLMGQYGTAVFDVLKQNEKFSLAKQHFAELTKDEAIEELTTNSAYITNLGKSNYNKLLEELKARE